MEGQCETGKSLKQLYGEILNKENLRENLAALRKRVKEGKELEAFRQLLLEKGPEEAEQLFEELFRQEDPKVRKHGALLAGELQEELLSGALYRAYEREGTLFARSAYLKAMLNLDMTFCLEPLKQHFGKLLKQEVPPENQKHYREEMTLLRELLSLYQNREHHEFTGYGERYDVILTTNRNYREITAKQVHESRVFFNSLGVKAPGAQLKELLKIRTFQDLLFGLDVVSLEAEPEQAALGLAGSDLWELLQKAHGGGREFRFRITLSGRMMPEKRGTFVKKCSFTLEQESGGRLRNAPSDYEIELLLLERAEGTLLPLVKLHTLKDPRFSYRKHSLPVSVKPSAAALFAWLAKPYLKEGAQVLDPFCGVGTMLLERDKLVKAGTMYGIDIFGEAIRKARENTERSGREIYYVNRDFFAFAHEYLFDEIFTNMPVRGKKTKEEQEIFYQKFFVQAECLLKPGGILILYSNEKGYIRKQIRLQGNFKLMQEYPMDQKDNFSLFIMKKRG